MRKLVRALLILFSAFPALAQTIRITAWPDGIASLNQGWRTHAGDNAAWSAPAFEDSSWEPIASLNESEAGARLATPGLRWYRIHLHL